MSKITPDWDPRAAEVLGNPSFHHDRMRQHCPVAYSPYLHYSIFRHADVMQILQHPQTWSSQASTHVSVPNSMDGHEHAAWRQVIDPYFSSGHMDRFRPACQRIATELVDNLHTDVPCEMMQALAYPFAVRAQCAFMGWPESVHEPLRVWIGKKNAATLSGDKQAITAVATEFDATIRALLKTRRAAGSAAPHDVTTRLMRETIHGRPLREAEIVSILRNWTVGELGTIASAVGIIAHYLAVHPDLQHTLRRNPQQIWQANDEILRMHAPLAANRRRATCPVTLGGRTIANGERVTLMWASANRDEAVFGNPDGYDPQRNAPHNLLYGAGVHACPGAPLARMELVIVIQTLLAQIHRIRPLADCPPVPAIYPASGYRDVFLNLQRN